MHDRLILKVTKFQLPPPERLSTLVKNILGGHHGTPGLSRSVVTMHETVSKLRFCSKTCEMLKSEKFMLFLLHNFAE